MQSDEQHARPASLVLRRLSVPQLAAIGVAVLVLLATVGYTLVRSQQVTAGESQFEVGQGADEEVAMQTANLVVHVLGAVHKAGVYELAGDSRVQDAIRAAGGAADDADLGALNLARLVTDGEQIRVPTAAESAAAVHNSVAQQEGLVNVNTATGAQLEELPGVGPALAGRIVAWRETNGAFKTVEDLLSVSGIGEKLLAAMRAQITV